MLVDNSTFIITLEKLAQSARNDSSITITFKRYDGRDRPEPRPDKQPLPKPEENLCLIRAKSKSKKVSTIVRSEEVPKMMAMFSQFMKSNIDGLKRIKKVKSKAKAAKG